MLELKIREGAIAKFDRSLEVAVQSRTEYSKHSVSSLVLLGKAFLETLKLVEAKNTLRKVASIEKKAGQLGI